MESGSTISPAAGRAVDAPTLTEALRRTAANHPEIVAVRTPDDSVSLTWAELLRRVEAVAGGLAKLGVGRGDTVAIMLANRPEFHIVDLAAAMLGATPFSIYLTYPPAEIEYLLSDSATRVAIVEQAHMGPLLEARKEVPGLEHVIVVDGDAAREHDCRSRTSRARTRSSIPEKSLADIGPDDLVTLIYTSGTTGPPKGVQLSHHNIMSGTKAVEGVIQFDAGSKVMSWLPAAHIAERMAHHYIPVVYAGTITCCPNPREVLSYLPQVRPTWFFAVPRIWEKLKAGLETMQAAQPEEQRRPVQEAVAAAIRARAIAPARRARAGRARGEGRPGRRADVLQAARDARPRPGDRGQRRRRADSRRGARVLPRARDRAGGAVGDVRDVRGRHVQPARGSEDRHGRAGRAGRRDQDRRRRRAARPRRLRDERATETRRTRRPRRSTPTAGSTPGTSGRSTRTASFGSSTARRRSSSMRPARTCRRPTSRPRSSRRAR